MWACIGALERLIGLGEFQRVTVTVRVTTTMLATSMAQDVCQTRRGDRNGVGEDEVTITSGLHAQAERTNKQTNRSQGREGQQKNRRERATSGEGFDQDLKSGDVVM